MHAFDPIGALRGRRHTDPSADALVALGTRMSVAELWDSATHCAHLLAAHGAGPGVVVGVELPALLQPVFVLALWRSGAIGAVVPSGSSTTLAAAVDLLVTSQRRADFPVERQAVIDAGWLVAAPSDASEAGDRGLTLDDRSTESPSRIIFSSGTSGAPKAIPFAASDIADRVRRATDHWMRDRTLTLLSLGTISGSAAFFAALQSGRPYLVPGSSEESIRLLAQTGASTVHGSPAQLADLLRAYQRVGVALPAVTHIQSVGSPLSDRLAGELAAVFDAEVEVIYGATEVGAVSLRRGAPTESGDVGVPLDSVEVEIVGDGGARLAPGTEGAIRIRSTLRKREMVEGVSPDGWFSPGDVGRMVDGRLVVLGRSDDLLNASGVKVAPEAIEQGALEFDGVGDAAAVAVLDGKGVLVIALAVVADGSVALADLLDFLRPRLGDATPRIVERVNALPRTENGKLRRTAVADSLQKLLDRDVRL